MNVELSAQLYGKFFDSAAALAYARCEPESAGRIRRKTQHAAIAIFHL